MNAVERHRGGPVNLFRKPGMVITLLIAFNLLFVAGAFYFPRHSWISHLWTDLFFTLASLGCSLKLLNTSRQSRSMQEKSAWLWLSAGAFLFFLGMLGWSWFELVQGTFTPLARLPDLGFIGMAICFLFGTLCFRTLPSSRHYSWLFLSEVGIALCLILLLGGILLYHPIEVFAGDRLYLIVSLFRAILYPISALCAALFISQSSTLIFPRVALLLQAGFAIFAGLYLAFSYTAIAGLYEAGSPMDVTWNIAFSFLFFAGFQRNQLSRRGSPMRKTQRQYAGLYTMVWLWGFFLVSFGVGIASFWQTLGGIVRFLLTILAITSLSVILYWELLLANERKIRQELLKALQLRDDFLSIAAHELRTPLTPLRLQIQLIQQGLEQVKSGNLSKVAQISRYAATTGTDLERFTRLVNNLLDVATVRSGQLLQLKPSDCPLAQVVESVLGRFQRELQAAGIRVVKSLDPEIRGRWDCLRIEQAVTNLIVNAWKYSHGTRIDIELKPHDQMAQLMIRDNGVGIRVHQLDQTFEPFERYGPGKSDRGLGLGLFITREIIKAHLGRLAVRSVPGKGTTFMIDLPLRYAKSLPFAA
jgi:signal transduction histidine kinase